MAERDDACLRDWCRRRQINPEAGAFAHFARHFHKSSWFFTMLMTVESPKPVPFVQEECGVDQAGFVNCSADLHSIIMYALTLGFDD